MIVLGCDPGVTGGLAIVDIGRPKLISAIAMPVTTVQAVKWADGGAIAGWFETWAEQLRQAGLAVDRIIVESPGSRPLGPPAQAGDKPNSGRRSLHNEAVIARMAGGAMGALLTLRLPMHTVTPKTWKTRATLLGRDKKASLALARTRLGHPPELKREGADGLAEACLIALYGSAPLSLPGAVMPVRTPRPVRGRKAA